MNTQIKGMAIACTFELIKSRYGQEVFQQILNELSEEDRQILGRTILPSLWYSLKAFNNFLKAEVKIVYNGNSSKLQKGSEEIVNNQLKGIYKFFVKLGSPEFVVGRIGSVNNSYFNGIELEKEISTGRFVGKYRGFEADQELFEEIIIGFYKKALEISGAKNIQARFDIPISQGKDYAQILVTWN
ncbi:MAG: hypothetical protein JXR22_02985 [Prolixibacteraceae bacterium]|nr:hypothetical protein [Prolixibacteraceae bacterium]